MKYPLHVAFLWHMHQPDYLDPRTGEYALPWVRLHAAKDYLRMAEIVARHLGMHMTVNFVPVLLEQIQAYAEGRAQDRALAVSRKKNWTRQDKEFLLSFFFHVNEKQFLDPSPRYKALKQKRDAANHDPAAFSQADYLDLIALFNLSWMDSEILDADADFQRIAAKGSGYTADDLQYILGKQQEIITRILPAYRDLAAAGQVELTTSPYYHPILPLLINTDMAEIAGPHLPVPQPPFRAPEDAREQLARAVQAHLKYFGHAPKGLWPSEGAVGADLLPLVREAGFRWFASDEAILARSLHVSIERDASGDIRNPAVLCQPYSVGGADGSLAAIFRDHVLSDRVGFVYQGMSPEEGVNDLIRRLHAIHDQLKGDGLPYLVSIILDGENAWEYYQDNGSPFLHKLYQGLVDDPVLKPVTVSEYLEQFPPRASIARLFTGSWINGNLETWIGEPSHNQAWSALRETREWLVAQQKERSDGDALGKAWNEVYRAEGSDWFWWYSSRNRSEDEPLFDALYRARLSEVYKLLDATPPESLEPSLMLEAMGREVVPFIPAVEAQSAPDLWKRSLTLVPAGASTGPAQRASLPARHVHLYHDEERLHLRLETYDELDGRSLEVQIWPNDDLSQNPASVHFAPARNAVEDDGSTGQAGNQWMQVSIPLTAVGAKEFSLRAALIDQSGEYCWVPSEDAAGLVLEALEG